MSGGKKVSKRGKKKANGGLKAPIVPKINPDKFIIIESSDGFRFWVEERCVDVSEVWKDAIAMRKYTLDGVNRVIKCKYDSNLVEKVVEYFHYKRLYDHNPTNRPPFIIKDNEVLPLLVASNELKT